MIENKTDNPKQPCHMCDNAFVNAELSKDDDLSYVTVGCCTRGHRMMIRSGDGSGYGSGDGSGDGSGSGYGSGYGSGDGSGSGVGEFNYRPVYRIDGVQTIITAVKGNVAKGFILQSDLSLTPCFVVKGNNIFAHGDDLHGAMAALRDKMFEDMPEEERIAAFIKEHPDKDKAYPNKDLFDWHNRLTGSCMAGRKAFVKNKGLTLDGETTVTEFIRLTESAYGGSTIKALKKAYKE